MRNIFGQPVNKIHPRRIMDEKKIFIVNLAKGVIGDDAARIIGALLIAQFFSAALTRADVPEEERPDFSLVVDEFTSFSTTVIAKILSEARKYRLSLCIGSQFLGTIDEETEQAIFGNAGAVVSFRVGEEDAALLARHFGNDYLPQAFSSLDNHTVLVKQLMGGITQDPFVGFTQRFERPDVLAGKKVRYLDPKDVIHQSRRHYTERREVIAKKLERWMLKDFPQPSNTKNHRKGSDRTSDVVLREQARKRHRSSLDGLFHSIAEIRKRNQRKPNRRAKEKRSY